MIVASTLAQWRASAFKWGETDCIMSVADYIRDATGIDHAARFRGVYADEAGAYAIIAENGGAAALFDAAGLERTDDPARGDAVLIECDGRLIAGVHTGKGVAFRLPRGIVEVDRRFVKIAHAWKIER